MPTRNQGAKRCPATSTRRAPLPLSRTVPVFRRLLYLARRQATNNRSTFDTTGGGGEEEQRTQTKETLAGSGMFKLPVSWFKNRLWDRLYSTSRLLTHIYISLLGWIFGCVFDVPYKAGGVVLVPTTAWNVFSFKWASTRFLYPLFPTHRVLGQAARWSSPALLTHKAQQNRKAIKSLAHTSTHAQEAATPPFKQAFQLFLIGFCFPKTRTQRLLFFLRCLFARRTHWAGRGKQRVGFLTGQFGEGTNGD